MASNAIPEKSQKPKPAAGILGYFQKKTSPSGTKNIPNPGVYSVGDDKASGLMKSQETSPGIDKENKSKLVVKMKPRGTKKKRKKIEMEGNSSEDDLELDVILNVKKRKFVVSSDEEMETRPSSSEPNLDIEKVVTVPKPEPEPVQISADEVPEDSEKSKTLESKPKKSISSFFQKVTKAERLHKVEKDNSCVEVTAIVHESPENLKTSNSRKPSSKLKSPNISKKPRKSRKSNVSISAAESEKIELLEVEEIVEKSKEEEEEKKVLFVEKKNDAEKNLESEEVVRKISNNLFRKTKTKSKIAVKPNNDEESDDSVNIESHQNSPVKNIESATISALKNSAKVEDESEEEMLIKVDDKRDVKKNLESEEVVRKISNNLFRKTKTKRKIAVKPDNDEESDDSVNMESLQNSPVKSLRSATNSPLKKLAKIEDLDQTEASDEKMDCRETNEEEKSEEPEPSKDLKKIPMDEKLKNMLSVLQSVEDLVEDSDSVTPLAATPKNSRTPRAKKKKPPVAPEPQIEKSEIPESPSVGRRSGRIARKSSVLDERKRIQEEQEKRLEESDRKIELERKIRNAAVAKQKKLLAGKMSESQVSQAGPETENEADEAESDSDCQIEEEVVASPRRKKTSKLASIFMKAKKPEDRPAEDPAVVAARKAFLMSAAPETLRTQMCRAGEEEREERGLVWPGPASLPSHTGLDQAQVSSQPVQLSGQWRFRPDLQPSPVPPPVLTRQTTPEDRSVLPSRQLERMSEASVLVTVESKVETNTWPSLAKFNSLIERKVRTETLEAEAREAKVSVSEVKAKDQKKGRGKRRRSRRSVEVARPSAGGRYQVEAGSGLVWTSKYEPRCGGDVLGNCGEVGRLRDWLSTWTSGGGRARGGSTISNSASELTSDSEFESDQEVGEAPGGNTALLVGPTGCGKTATVFALAAELGFNVLEVNASRNRTGKQVRTEESAVRNGNILIF